MNVFFILAVALALDPPFCDHAVLQRDKPVVVRGSSDAGAEVTVSFAGNTAKGVADAAGHFFCEDRSLQGRVAGRMSFCGSFMWLR